MRIHPRIAVVVALFLVCASPAARASYGSKPDMPSPAAANGEAPRANGTAQSPREQAEAWYRDAYKDVEKGSSEAAAGRADQARKKFARALERSRRATELDSTYHQAWNLVGFTSRKLGDYPGSFAAYRVALRLKPDYALAREYYGEGLLETGDLAGAKQQLAALERIGDAAMTRELGAAIAAYEAAHPAAAADTARSGEGR